MFHIFKKKNYDTKEFAQLAKINALSLDANAKYEALDKMIEMTSGEINDLVIACQLADDVSPIVFKLDACTLHKETLDRLHNFENLCNRLNLKLCERFSRMSHMMEDVFTDGPHEGFSAWTGFIPSCFNYMLIFDYKNTEKRTQYVAAEREIRIKCMKRFLDFVDGMSERELIALENELDAAGPNGLKSFLEKYDLSDVLLDKEEMRNRARPYVGDFFADHPDILHYNDFKYHQRTGKSYEYMLTHNKLEFKDMLAYYNWKNPNERL